MIQRRERVAEFGEVIGERFGGVNVERRAVLLGERGDGNALTMECIRGYGKPARKGEGESYFTPLSRRMISRCS